MRVAGIASAQIPSPSARARRRRALRLRREMVVMVCARIVGLLVVVASGPGLPMRRGPVPVVSAGGSDRAVYARLIRSKSGPAAEVEVGLRRRRRDGLPAGRVVSPASQAVSLSQPLGSFADETFELGDLPLAPRMRPGPSPGAPKTPHPTPCSRSASRDACFWYRAARAGTQLAEGALLRCAKRGAVSRVTAFSLKRESNVKRRRYRFARRGQHGRVAASQPRRRVRSTARAESARESGRLTAPRSS